MTFYGRFVTLVVVIVALCSLAVSAADCESITSKSSCTAAKCSWCTSGAVGSSCMTNADAAGLPSSVFTCTSTLSATGNYSTQKPVLTVEPSKLFPNAVAPLEEEFIYFNPPPGVVLDDSNQDGPLNANVTSTVSASSYKSDRYGFSSLFFSEYAYCDFMNANYANARNTYTRDFHIYTKVSADGGNNLGFVGYQPSIAAIVVSFRGSTTFQNWVDNLDLLLVNYSKCSDCSVHSGFQNIKNSLIDQVKNAVAALNSQYPSYNILVTGHSLGGALATLTALDLVGIYGSRRIHLYNYGSPRVFNDVGANYADSKLSNVARRTHRQDIVVHLPWTIQGYRHISGEIYENGEDTNFAPNTALQNCNGQEDSKCADQWTWIGEQKSADHLYYSGVKMGSGGCYLL